jgi:hypothetical protein
MAQMENQTLAEPKTNIDNVFLDAVEVEIALALKRTTDLEVGLDSSSFEPDPAWKDAFVTMSANLANWHNRLAELSRQTAAVESELNEQEHALREWFQALGPTSSRLAEAATPSKSR